MRACRVLRGAELAFFGPANSYPSALCQNMLGVHLDCCPRASAPGGSCGRLHDNSRNAGNCCTWNQMLLCTCGLISWGSLPPLPPTLPAYTTFSLSLPPPSLAFLVPSGWLCTTLICLFFKQPCYPGTVQRTRDFGGNQSP